MQKPALLAVNKLDVPGAPELYAALKAALPVVVKESGLNLQRVVPMSVKAGYGLDNLKEEMQRLLLEHAEDDQSEAFADALLR